MTDVTATVRPAGKPTAISGELAGDQAVDLIELLFFAYRDFTSDPDVILAQYGFGRAHHRVLHFVARNPGLTVADLLEILKITKQSLGRVLKQLIDSGFIEQRTGSEDRRQRLLYATNAGITLARRLAEPQSKRIRAALAGLPAGGRETVAQFLFGMVDAPGRSRAAALARMGRKP
ncbi:MarR family winged helix-turn-helix transcriptional regulator [Propylenella binzhouense]|uniref:MarR family transcriptional regulator n=1 Tax=Propylenella binzhouense TaxID=2555902 RepID=A0A964WU87_9HYPH|nr:MarR family transcriptional regulator [Propylenella binzhouense]MYZ48847.1 MarR family transcriptional regulator [Propylenella binzhouense]